MSPYLPLKKEKLLLQNVPHILLGNMKMLTITCTLVMIKDVIFHRMGRVQCWLFYKIRKLLQRQKGSIEEFHVWYFDERFCNFRACVLNNDLLHEFTGISNVLIIPSSFADQCLTFLYFEKFAPVSLVF